MHQKIQPVSSNKVCSSKKDVHRCTKKSSQFQANKVCERKTMCSDAPKNLASFKQYSMFKQKRCAAMHQKIQPVSSNKVCSRKNDVPRCNKKSSQFQAVKYVQAKTMCTDAPKNLASFKQKSMFKQKRSAAMHQKIQPVSSSKVCSSKNDVQRCTKKSSQFQAIKYVQAKTMCSDAPKNLASFKQ